MANKSTFNPDNKLLVDKIIHASGNAGGMLVGNRHSNNGIKAINHSTGQALEMEGGEVVITRNAVADNKKRSFNGEMLTNRQILSNINVSGGGISFADGGKIPNEIRFNCESQYEYGGKTMCGKALAKKLAKGGITKNNNNSLSVKDILEKIEASKNKKLDKGGAILSNSINPEKNKFTYEETKIINSEFSANINIQIEQLKVLLPKFQGASDSINKALLLKELFRLNNKLEDEFISANEKYNEKNLDNLFSPIGLLKYYYRQATQSPVLDIEPPCGLPTPNGLKSKLPLGAYLNTRTKQFKDWFGDWEAAYKTGNYIDCSKMIDEETKEPKIYYHGVRKFESGFKSSNMGNGIIRPYGSFEPPNFNASYFSDAISYAEFYGGLALNMPKPNTNYKPFIYKVFLNIKNPVSIFDLDFELSYSDLKDYLFVKYGVKIQLSNTLLKQVENENKTYPMWIYVRNDMGIIETLKDYGYDGFIQIGDIPVFGKNGQPLEDRKKHIREKEVLNFYPNQVKSALIKKSFYLQFMNDIRFKDGGYVSI
jgi:hypothetical protein